MKLNIRSTTLPPTHDYRVEVSATLYLTREEAERLTDKAPPVLLRQREEVFRDIRADPWLRLAYMAGVAYHVQRMNKEVGDDERAEREADREMAADERPGPQPVHHHP